MATPTFPVYLTLSMKDFAEQPEPAVYRTPMEGGVPKQLAKSSRVLVKRPVVYLAKTKADYLTFLTFVRTTIRNASDWFNWTDPVDGVTKLARISEGKYTCTPWTPTLSHWDISMTLETWSA
jgi:hypothetical protein